jgi:zinc protease
MIRVFTLFAALLFTLPASAEVRIQEVTSPGGFTAWLVEEHSLPFTALEIRFRGGGTLDTPGKRGALNLMTGLIEEGAGGMDARGFAEAREALAASFDFDLDDDTLSVSARFLTENRDAAVALLHLALTEPRFDTDAVERVRGQVISHLRNRDTDPDDLASTAFDRLAFGEHPYATYYGGTVDSVRALSRADVVEAYERAITRERIYVAAVGDITADELGALVDVLFDGLPETGATLPTKAEFGLAGGTTVIPFETPQSVARFGHAGIDPDDPDYFAAYVVNEIFAGAGFNSRLMEEVREKRGLTYGVGAYLVGMDQANLLYGHVASANETMAETIAVIRAEWARIGTDGVTQEELSAAQTYLTGAYPLRFDGNATIAQIMVAMQLVGKPIDYIASRNDNINAVTLEQANRVAAQLYQPDALHFVVVGQPEGVKAAE